MKILTTKKINELDIITTEFYELMDSIPVDSPYAADKEMQFYKLNKIRRACGLEPITRFTPFQPIKPQKECSHVYEIAFTPGDIPFLFCKFCGEVKKLTLPKYETYEGK